MCNSVTKNLGLGEGSALPVGVPVPWPSATPPEGWLKCNGATFSATLYPKLALAYPSGKLPDLRGEFIRGWDDGRGVDSGRGILTFQESTLIAQANGRFGSFSGQVISNPDSIASSNPAYTRYDITSTSFGNGTDYFRIRPRNIAFNYIVRAA